MVISIIFIDFFVVGDIVGCAPLLYIVDGVVVGVREKIADSGVHVCGVADVPFGSNLISNGLRP